MSQLSSGLSHILLVASFASDEVDYSLGGTCDCWAHIPDIVSTLFVCLA